MSQQKAAPRWYKPTNLVVGLVAVLIAIGATLWVVTDGFGTQLEAKSANPADYPYPEGKSPVELPSESAPAFAEVTILASDELPVTTPSCMQSFGVTFAGRMTSETVQLNGVTFNRNAERTVIDVPVELGQLYSMTVDGSYVHIMTVPATYKISYFFPRNLWGEVNEVSVCIV